MSKAQMIAEMTEEADAVVEHSYDLVERMKNAIAEMRSIQESLWGDETRKSELRALQEQVNDLSAQIYRIKSAGQGSRS